MEQPQQQQQNDQENGGGGSSGKGSGFMSRQSSTRWTPTTDQIRILKDLYYNNGIRSPSAEQIQRISARLRQYGKIEGKNVFYWFQNHKARERQKKRFTSDVNVLPIIQRPPNNISIASPNWKPDHEQQQQQQQQQSILHTNHSNYNISSSGLSSASCSSAEMVAIGYGSVPMEKSFRECCTISAGCSSSQVGSTMNNHLGWIGHHHHPHHVDPYSSSPYANIFEKITTNDEIMEEEEYENGSPEIETLPLFPMHGEDIHGGYCNLKSNSSNYAAAHGWYQGEDHGFINASRTTSLELSLNSYTRRSPDYAN